jgi:hypothetical protein
MALVSSVAVLTSWWAGLTPTLESVLLLASPAVARKPEIGPVSRSGLLGRLGAFLPQLAEANATIDPTTAGGDFALERLPDSDVDTMTALGLTVPADARSSDCDSSDSSDGETSRGSCNGEDAAEGGGLGGATSGPMIAMDLYCGVLEPAGAAAPAVRIPGRAPEAAADDDPQLVVVVGSRNAAGCSGSKPKLCQPKIELLE